VIKDPKKGKEKIFVVIELKAAVLEDFNKLVVKDVAEPHPKAGMVVIRVKSCGICLTDFKAYKGLRTNVRFPAILGHEFSGEIIDAGPGVQHFKIGDEVIVSPVSNCGICEWCRSGRAQYCENGSVIGGDGLENFMDGAFAEMVLVPESVLYHKPPNISFDVAALSEPLAGAYKGLIEYSGLKIAEDVVIIGAGSMGLLATMIADKAGAASIIVLDINDWRLEKACELGATHQININEGDPIREIYNIVPEGPDLVFEAAGALSAAKLAFDLCRRGSRINVFGVTTAGNIEISPAQIHWKETRVDASFSITPRTMTKSIRLQEKKIIDAGKIITHKFRLDEIIDAMELLADNNARRIKIIIKP